MHWLAWRIGCDPRTARELTRIATHDNEQTLLDLAKAGTAAHLSKLVQICRRVSLNEQKELEKHYDEQRYLHAYHDEDGMLVLEGRLPPEYGEVVPQALNLAIDMLYRKEQRGPAGPSEGQEDISAGNSVERDSLAQRRVDALGFIAETMLAQAHDEEHQHNDKCQIVLHVEPEVLANPQSEQVVELESGAMITPETARRLACDASVVKMTHDAEGALLNVGRKTRQISPALHRALRTRDRFCQFPGCTHTLGLEAHHIVHWAQGGETRLDNLATLCRRCHRRVHDGGFVIKRDDRGRYVFVAPRGDVFPSTPLSLHNTRVEALSEDQHARGVWIDASTSPTWGGERMDVDWAMMALHRH